VFRTTLKDLKARKLRLLTTSLAVLLGVAFMAGTLVLTDTIGRSFDGLFANANAGTDVYVRGETAFAGEMGDERARLDADLVDTVASLDGVAAAEGTIEAYAQMVDKDGDPIGNPAMGAPTFGGSWIANDDLNPFELDEGRAPQTDDEVVIDRGTATAGHLALGDSTTVLTQAGPQAVEIVGIATFGGEDSPGGSSYTFFTPTAAQAFLTAPGKIDAIAVVAADGYSDEELRTQVADGLPHGTEVLTGAEITAEQQGDVKEGLGFFNTFLLAFAAIALFVGSFIIYNSFSILVAQRTKQMALLRAVGASRRQVVASLVGLGAGVGFASMLMGLLDAIGIDIPAGSVVITARTIVTALVAGLGVSVASAVFPAVKASKVPPIAAMRDVAIDTSANSPRRVVIGLGVTALGAVAIAGGLFADAGIAMVAVGAAVVFVGVAVLGPVIARPMSRVIGWPLPRVKGMSGTLARENAMRNP
jgi:putative ABC transport system permease protein